MPFLILFLLVLAAQPLPWPASPFGWGTRVSLLATAGAAVVPALMAAWLGRRTCRRLMNSSADRERTIHVYHSGRTIQLLVLLAAEFTALGLFGWGATVRTWCGDVPAEELPFGAELLLIAPFVFGLVLTWAAIYPTEQVLAGWSRPYGGRWAYVKFQARQYLTLIGLPLGLMVTARGLQWALGKRVDTSLMLCGLFGLVGATLVLAPLPLRLILGARPLPPGPIRDRLIAAGRRMRFRYSDILLWDTRNGIANAMVAGPIPWVRDVFLSDRLLAELSPAEVEAVFGHEVGHVRHRHFLFYAAFMGLSVVALTWLWSIAGTWLLSGPLANGMFDGWVGWEAVPVMLLIGIYVFVVFGFLSRRCERQADVYGCRAVSHDDESGADPPAAENDLCPIGIRTFISALDKVAVVNGISRRRPGLLSAWLHGTIARRIEFLEGVLADRTTEERFQRRLGLLKWGVLAGLAAGLLALAVGHWNELRQAMWPT